MKSCEDMNLIITKHSMTGLWVKPGESGGPREKSKWQSPQQAFRAGRRVRVWVGASRVLSQISRMSDEKSTGRDGRGKAGESQVSSTVPCHAIQWWFEKRDQASG